MNEQAEGRPGAAIRYADDVRKPKKRRLDEVFVHDPKNIHIEQMDDGAWWMRIERPEGDALVVNLWTKGNKRIHARAEWD